MRLPPLRAVQCFEAVARLNSFSLAAQELHVTQSAVSHQVKLLEEYLSQQLFDRQGRTFSLTTPGVQYFEEVTNALGNLSYASQTIKEGRSDNVRLALYSSLAVKWLIPRLDEFSRLHPHIELSINMVTDKVEYNDQISDCFITVDPPQNDYVGKLLYKEKLVPVCGKRLWKKMKKGPFPEVLWQQTMLCARYFGRHEKEGIEWYRWCQSAGIEFPANIKISQFSHALLASEAAKCNMGVMLMDSLLMKNQSDMDSLVVIPSHELYTGDSYYFIYKNTRKNNPDIIALENWLKEQCR